MRAKSREAILQIIRRETPYLRSTYGVERIALYGSFARDDATVSSDVDLIVSLSRPLGFGFIQMAEYLEEKLGRKVDLVTFSTLEAGMADPRRAHIARAIQESLVYV